MGMTRVWNTSDDPTNKVTPASIMVLGKTLKPGRSLQVDEGALARAHKLHKDVSRGAAFIGKKPPAGYLARKKPARARLEKGVQRTHGAITKAEAAAVVEKAKVEVTDTVKVEDKAEVELKPAEAEETTEEAKEPSEESSTSRRRRGR